MLTAQVAVGVLAGNHHGGGLQARLVAVLVVQGLALETVAVAPVLVHAEEHGRPVLGLGAACAGVDGEHTVVGVVLTGEEGGETCLLDVVLQLGEALLQLVHHGVVVALDAHLAQDQEVLHGVQAFLMGGQLVLKVFDALGDLLGLLHVVPKILGGALGLKQVQLFFGSLQAQGVAQLSQDGFQVVQLYLILIIFNGCHIQIVPFDLVQIYTIIL